MATRLGVDVGGTFTDLVYYDDDAGEVLIAKGPTTPDAQEQGVLAVLHGAVSPDALASTTFFLHGTTVGINALLQRTGARVGLLTTAGFRDVLEIRRGDRGQAMYDALWVTPEPLVPRYLRLGVRERVAADGTVLVPVAPEDVGDALAIFREAAVDAVAVVFLNAYANPANELVALDALRAEGFSGDVSLSHAVSGEFREYERTSTTTVDAYVRPAMSTYLRRLESSLREAGFAGSCLITRSGGGAVTFSEGAERAFETIMSGPAAGAVGAEVLCQRLGLRRAVTADVGGTSFDTALIRDGRASLRFQGEVEGMPLQAPWIDVRSIGAGGGSLAFVDSGGLLRVGPRSAGAVPGPISYGRGGTQPTVTDAAAALGMLGAGEIAGSLTLDIEPARVALGELGRPLGLDADRTAAGIIEIANAAMAKAIRSVTIEQGEDPREASLIAFGGAGPLFGTLLARELGMREVVVPLHAGNFSAWGLLDQDILRDAARTIVRPLDADGLQQVRRVAVELESGITARAPSARDETTTTEVALDLRYHGQEHTLTVEAPGAAVGRLEAAALAASFNDTYRQRFGYVLAEPVEIVTVRVALRTHLPAPRNQPPRPQPRRPVSVEAYSFARCKRAVFPVVVRDQLAVAGLSHGPAIVTEETATTYVDAGFSIDVLEDGTLRLRDAAVDS
jgi:N-methylhydantoinase A